MVEQAGIEDAIALAAHAHRGASYASPEREPYVFHPLRLMLQFRDPTLCTVAVLHDVVEDTHVSLDDLVAAGFDGAVVGAVDALTRRQTENYAAYIERIALNPIARAVKLADLQENLNNNERLDPTPATVDRICRYRAAIERLRPTST